MLSANLSTSTPKRRSTRVRRQKPRDELSSNDLSDISMVSSICSPVRDFQLSQSINSTKKSKVIDLDLSAIDSKSTKLKKINFRQPLAVRQDQIENKQPTVRRSARNVKENANDQIVNEKRKRKFDQEKTKTIKNVSLNTSKRRRHLEKSDFIESDLDHEEIDTRSDQVASELNESMPSIPSEAEDGLDLSFKSPPARTYSFLVHRRRSELDHFIENEPSLFEEDHDQNDEDEEQEEHGHKMNHESEKQLPVLKVKGKTKRKPTKRQTKEKLGSWENAMKKNKQLEQFVNAFNRELSEIESVPLSVIRTN